MEMIKPRRRGRRASEAEENWESEDGAEGVSWGGGAAVPGGGTVHGR